MLAIEHQSARAVDTDSEAQVTELTEMETDA